MCHSIARYRVMLSIPSITKRYGGAEFLECRLEGLLRRRGSFCIVVIKNGQGEARRTVTQQPLFRHGVGGGNRR